ncbi:hypothetical protein TEA_001498 [Camellia sinensis var. sinensis]|uniref:Uncharacterized protein n=1 Tax=Camellia sinensis var. sinensis TaxID=542762 RepID=A0A4S4E899_CAMSN|nr:hypothetical protein TEA_001498 [Camellia sinensis var. sinensis]
MGRRLARDMLHIVKNDAQKNRTEPNVAAIKGIMEDPELFMVSTMYCCPRLMSVLLIASSTASSGVQFTTLESAIAKKDSDAVKEALDQLSEVGWANKWSSQPYVSCRMTSLRELTTLGIKNAENLAIPSVRNDAAFLFTVVGTTGFLGVLAGQLPGDWGFFVPYLIESISLVVLAVGSIPPGLLQAAIGGFSSLFPDYQDRIARHEAAHFLDACAALDLEFSPKSSCCCQIWTKSKAMTIVNERVVRVEQVVVEDGAMAAMVEAGCARLLWPGFGHGEGEAGVKKGDEREGVGIMGRHLLGSFLKFDTPNSLPLLFSIMHGHRDLPYVAYLLGLPILGYSLDIGKEHVNLIDKKLEKLIYSGQLDAKELDRLAVVAVAGLAAEGLQYDKVVGQSADLFTLQRLINRSKPQLSKEQQQNLTRWAVLFAGSLLKNNKVIHESLMSAMSKKATVLECIEAIEKAS